jgi:ADP-ribosylglycohydrolase
LVENRVVACFKALATGDAVAKQTETLAHAEVRRWYPAKVRGFEGSPGTVIPRYRAKRYEWKIGETTDDTEQTLAVARAILKQQGVTHGSVGLELLRCVKSIHPAFRCGPLSNKATPTGLRRMAMAAEPRCEFPR